MRKQLISYAKVVKFLKNTKKGVVLTSNHPLAYAFGVTSKNGLHVFFCKPWVSFLKSNNAGRHLYPDFQGFFSDFQQIKTLGVALEPPQPPPPTPLLYTTVS